MANTVVPPPTWSDRLRSVSIGRALTTVILFLGAWVMVFPFIWLISSSLKPTDEVYDSNFSIIPKTFAGFDNYYGVIFEQPYLIFLMNSMIVCLGILAIQLATAIPAAYALAKLKFRGSTILFGTVIAALTIPINVTSIPIYIGLVKDAVMGLSANRARFACLSA